MKNIHILATYEASRLGLHDGVLEYAPLLGFNLFDKNKNFRHNPQHIYITDNSEIKVGDWYYYKHFGEDIIDKANENTDLVNLNKPDRYFKKIILTTDETLIKQGIQRIGDDFLQWFCNNSDCEYVEVDLTPINEFGSIIKVDSYGFDKFIYQIILPQENNLHTTMDNKETIEEAVEKIAMDKLKDKWRHLYTFGYPKKPFPINYENDLNNVKVGVYEGTNWQKQQDASKYSEEDMQNCFIAGALTSLFNTWGISDENMAKEKFISWIKEYKKDVK